MYLHIAKFTVGLSKVLNFTERTAVIDSFRQNVAEYVPYDVVGLSTDI